MISLGHIKQLYKLSVVDSVTSGSVEVHFIFYTLPQRSYGVFLNLLIKDRLLLSFLVA